MIFFQRAIITSYFRRKVNGGFNFPILQYLENHTNLTSSSDNFNNLQPAASHTRQTLLKEKRKQQSKSDLAVTPVPYLAVYTPKASRVKPAAWNVNQSR